MQGYHRQPPECGEKRKACRCPRPQAFCKFGMGCHPTTTFEKISGQNMDRLPDCYGIIWLGCPKCPLCSLLRVVDWIEILVFTPTTLNDIKSQHHQQSAKWTAHSLTHSDTNGGSNPLGAIQGEVSCQRTQDTRTRRRVGFEPPTIRSLDNPTVPHTEPHSQLKEKKGQILRLGLGA